MVRRIVSYHAVRNLAARCGRTLPPINYSMAFTGAPGTCKTTVAKLCGKIFREAGITTNDTFIEAGRASMVGEYCGSTAVKVTDLFRKAAGGVLFIDEAYALVDHQENSYGDEAIDALVTELDKQRNNVVVILAGYAKEMDELFERNPGLRSRIPYTVHFNSYNPQELYEITGNIARKNGYILDADVRDTLMPVFRDAIDRQDGSFGNGRFVRNLVENAQMMRAESVFTSKDDIGELASMDELFTLHGCDFRTETMTGCAEARRSIGFR